jgi:ABC-type antimicrobial peptide transport system permease subunit
MLFRIVNHYDSEYYESEYDKIIEENNNEMIVKNYKTIEENDEIIEENNKEQRECFVCFEISLDKNDIISLKTHTDYFKFCECDGYIHINCLNLWYEKNEKCPICRNTVKKADNIELYNLYQYEYFLYVIYSYLVVKKTLANSFLFIIKISRCFIFYLFLFSIFNVINELYHNIINELKNEVPDNYLLDNYKEPLVNRIIPPS